MGETMAIHLTLAALETGLRETILVQVPATAAGQPTLVPAVAVRHASVAASALAADAAHLTLAALEMGRCETILVLVSATAAVQTTLTLKLTVTVQYESVAACALTEMGHLGTFLVQMPTETTASSEATASSAGSTSNALWNLNAVSGDPEASETQTLSSRQQLHFDAHTTCLRVIANFGEPELKRSHLQAKHIVGPPSLADIPV